MRRGADSAIRDYVQPQIVGDIYDIDLLYIATGERVICQLSKEKCFDAVIGVSYLAYFTFQCFL